MIAIEASDLSKNFGSVQAVRRLTLSIPEGEIFGFLGPNGSGKSTTIRMLCGVLPPSSGTAKIYGLDIQRQIDEIKPLIGYMSQKFGLYTDLTVEENLHFYSTLYLDRKTARDRSRLIMDSLDFGPYRTRLAAELSGGWKQRLALACALVHDPKVIFLDEPTAGIDPVSRRLMWDYLYELSDRGKTLFVTTHYMEEAERCHRIGFISRGVLAAMGSPEQIKGRFDAYELLSLRASDLNAAFRLIRGLADVIDVNLYGEELHVAVPRAEAAIPGIRSALEQAGLAVERIQPIGPSLEDVFVALSREKS